MLFTLFLQASISTPLADKYYQQKIEPQLNMTPHEYKELIQAVITVLFRNGKCLTVNNGIKDSIIHSRSGCGKDLPAGPELIKEMGDFKNYRKIFNDKDGVFVEYLKGQVLHASKTADSGIVSNQKGMSYVCHCLTLGGYTLYPEYDIPFSCAIKEDGKRYCSVDSTMYMSGRDYWDFEDVPSYGWLKNLIEERIPEWLVKLRGKNMKPFYTNYNVTTPYKFTIEVPLRNA